MTVVSQKDATFSPSFVVVPVGAAVEFRNDETSPLQHNVFSESTAKEFDSGMYGPEVKAYSITFDKPGEVKVRCSVHREMALLIYVTPSEHFCFADRDGRFSIPDVTPGEYTVRTYQYGGRRFKEADEKVTIAPGTPAELTLSLRR